MSILDSLQHSVAELAERCNDKPRNAISGSLQELRAALEDLWRIKAETGQEQGQLGPLHTHTAEQAARLKAIIDNAPEGIVVADQKARIVLANQAANNLYGWDVPYGEEYSSHARMMLAHRNGTPYNPRELPLTRAALDGDVIRGEEMVIVRPDGEKRNFLANAAPVYAGSGEPIGAVGLFQDITELSRVRQELERSRERLQYLREMDQAIIAARSTDDVAAIGLACVRQLLACSQATVALLDVRTRQMRILAAAADGAIRLESGLEEPLPRGSYLKTLRAGQVALLDNLAASRQQSGAVRKLLGVTGVRSCALLPLLVGSELLGSLNLGWNQPGRPSDEQLEVAQDIADQLAVGIEQAHLREKMQGHADSLKQRLAERTAALAASRSRLLAVFQSAPVGIAILNLEGIITRSNLTLSRMVGYRASALRARPFVSLLDGEDAREFAAALSKAQSEHFTAQRQTHRLMRKDKSVIWASTSLARVKGKKGQAAELLAVVDDITEEKQAREQLIQTEKLALTGRLAASLAHEINNPLQSVIGCLSLVEEAAAESSDFEEYLQVARNELQRAAGIITRLRDVHSPVDEAGRQPIDVNGLLEQVLLVTGKQAEDSSVAVSWAPGQDLPRIMALADRLQQVFLNLVLNAIDAMPEGGRLKVRTRRTADPDGVEIAVGDSGPGIDPSIQDSLFEPFQSTKPGGLGLGLYVSRAIIERHAGRIEVDSEPGRGTTFMVWLPA